MNRANWIGIGLTVVFHALLLGLCFHSGLKYIYPPPEEQAVLMEFPDEPVPPEQVVIGQEPRAEDPDPQQEVELVKRAESPVKGTTANLSEEATVGDDGDVEVPEPKREIDKRALFPSAANNKQDTLTYPFGRYGRPAVSPSGWAQRRRLAAAAFLWRAEIRSRGGQDHGRPRRQCHRGHSRYGRHVCDRPLPLVRREGSRPPGAFQRESQGPHLPGRDHYLHLQITVIRSRISAASPRHPSWPPGVGCPAGGRCC